MNLKITIVFTNKCCFRRIIELISQNPLLVDIIIYFFIFPIVQLFDRMKIENPTYRNQVQVIKGDCSQPNMGIDKEDVDRIKSVINVVIHLAGATANNNPALHLAVTTNIRGTRDLVTMVKRFQNLKVGMTRSLVLRFFFFFF